MDSRRSGFSDAVAGSLRALMDQVVESLGAYDQSGRILYVNPALARNFASEQADLVGRTIWEVFPGARESPFYSAFNRVVASGEPESIEYFYSQHERWYESSIYKANDLIWVLTRDTTETRLTEARRDAATQRLELLSSVSSALAHAGHEPGPTFGGLARLLAESLKDLCVIRLRSVNAEELGAVIGFYDNDPTTSAKLAQAPVHLSRDGLVGKALATKQAVLVTDPTELQSTVKDPEIRALLSSLRIASCMIAPIVVGDEGVGVLTMLRRHGQPAYTDDDVLLLQEVADRVALAVRNASIYQQAEQARYRLASITDALPVLVGFIDQDLRYKFVSRGYELWFGEPREAFVGKPMQEALGQETFEKVAPHVRRALAGEHVEAEFELNLPHRKGIFRSLYTPLRDYGALDGIVILVFDVTEERTIAAEKEASRRVLETLANNASLALVFMDEHQLCTYMNPAAEKMMGFKLSEVHGQRLHDLVHGTHPDGTPYPIEECPIDSALPRRRKARGEELLKRRDGDFFAVHYNASPILDPDGTPRGTVVELRDLTLEKQHAQALREAAQRKDEFLALLGHELRNPLAPILTALQIMQLRGDTTGERERAIIERQVRHMVELVDDLLDISRITRGKLQLRLEYIELSSVIAQSVEMASPLYEERAHKLAIHVPSEGLLVRADATRLAQVVSNLLTNAAKYTPRGGSVTLRAERSMDRVRIWVSDNGVGIAPDMLAQIFDPFKRGERAPSYGPGGLGLGLALVQSIVELHGGTVSAFSEGKGKGSTFTVELPAATRYRVRADAERRPREQEAGPHRRVLVVDDNEDAAEMIASGLRALGHEVQVAHDGPQALNKVRGFSPEIAVLDIGLPVMDGYELARALRTRLTPLPKLIAVTGYGQESDRERTREAGFDVHLVKPIDLDELARAVGEGPAHE